MNRSGGDLTVGPRWGGAALLRPGVLAFAGSIGITDTHAHHAVQIITATTAFTVLDEHGTRHRGTNVVVPADTPHRIEVGAEEGAMVFLDPESAPGRSAHVRAVRSGWTVNPVAYFHRSTSAGHHRRRGDRAPGLRTYSYDPTRRFDSTQLGMAAEPDYPSGYLRQMLYPFTRVAAAPLHPPPPAPTPRHRIPTPAPSIAVNRLSSPYGDE